MDRGEADNMNADRREMTDTCLIVSGGPTDRKFAAEFVKNRKYPYVIAVDAGLAVCEELGLVPDLAVGDFDTSGWNGWKNSERKRDGRRMSISRRRMRRTRILRSAPHSGRVSYRPCSGGHRGQAGSRAFQYPSDAGGEGCRTFHGDL
mgnify:CR=1 FL=1